MSSVSSDWVRGPFVSDCQSAVRRDRPKEGPTQGRKLMPRPPFRADHVGSFLRPERLRAAREQFAAGKMPVSELHAIEDECIREVVRAQENVGLTGITDGEFRRTYFHVDFLERLYGVEVRYGEFAAHFKKSDGTQV